MLLHHAPPPRVTALLPLSSPPPPPLPTRSHQTTSTVADAVPPLTPTHYHMPPPTTCQLSLPFLSLMLLPSCPGNAAPDNPHTPCHSSALPQHGHPAPDNYAARPNCQPPNNSAVQALQCPRPDNVLTTAGNLEGQHHRPCLAPGGEQVLLLPSHHCCDCLLICHYSLLVVELQPVPRHWAEHACRMPTGAAPHQRWQCAGKSRWHVMATAMTTPRA